MSMTEVINQLYGGTTPPVAPSQEKVAALAFMQKMAAREGLDLTKLSDAEVAILFDHYQKVAQEGEEAPPAPPVAEKTDDEKKKEQEAEAAAAAAAMSAEEKQAAVELAEADFIGRFAAHAMVHELGLIQKEAAAQNVEDQIPESVLKIAEARALQFLNEKIAEGALCKCGDPNCDGKSCDKTASAQQPTQDDIINSVAVEMLKRSGYDRLL
jgi:hypothetical protein